MLYKSSIRVDNMSMFPTKHVDVTILTHESINPPYDEAVVAMLTGHFSNFNRVLQTYFCIPTSETLHECIVVVDELKYRKTMIDNTRMLKVAASQQVHSEIMIIICHGTRSTADTCSFLTFCDHHSPQKIYNDPLDISACATRGHTDVTLKDVICASKLVVLSCCAGIDIVPEYLTEAAEGGPDILYFDAHEIRVITHHIVFEWLFNLVESDNDPMKTYLAKTKASIMRIMSIVKMFKYDAGSFWEFMQTIGMFSDASDIKKLQQLPCPSFYNGFKKRHLIRYNGDFAAMMAADNTGDFQDGVLRDFRNLCFVTWDNSRYNRHSVSTATDVQFSPDPELDVYLKRYHKRINAPVRSSEDSGDDTDYSVHDPGFPDSSSEDSGDAITHYARGMRFPDSSSEDYGDDMGNNDSSSDDY